MHFAFQVGIYLPFYDVFRVRMEEYAAENAPSVEPYVPFVAGAMARSLACTTCYPIELARTRMQVLFFPGLVTLGFQSFCLLHFVNIIV